MSGATGGTLTGAIVGGIIGTIINPGAGTLLGASIGASLGGTAGALYDYYNADDAYTEQPSINDIKIQTSTYGRVIPQVFGLSDIAGNIIWATDKQEHETRTSTSAGGKGGGPKQVTVNKTYSISWAIALADTRITGSIDHIRRVWRDTALIVNVSDDADPVVPLPGNWTFYIGTDSQNPDPVMEAVEGVGNVPGYRYLAYVVMEDEDLGASGRTPNYRFELALQPDDAGTPLAFVVTAILGACGISGANLDLTALPSGEVNMALVSLQAVRAPMEQLTQAFRFHAIESGTAVKCYPRGGGALVATIAEAELAAGEDAPGETSLEVVRQKEIALPRQLSLTYLDPSMDYQEGVQRAQLDLPAGVLDTQRNITLRLGLYANAAKQYIEEALAESWIQREQYSGVLGNAYAALEPGDRITLTARGIEYGITLTETTYGRPGLLAWQGIPDASYVRGTPVAAPAMGPTPTQQVGEVEDTTPVLLNLPTLNAGDMAPRYHVAYLPTNPAAWGGAALLRSTDSGSSYHQVSSNTAAAITGTVALATATGVTQAIDDSTTIVVVLDGVGTLQSVSDDALDAGANLCLIGSEVLAFGVATLTAPLTYELTHLYRGRRGTEYRQATHGTNERFVLLDSGVKAVPMALADAGIEYSFKAVTAGQLAADATPVLFTATALGSLPWDAASIDAILLDDGAWQLVWMYRPRFGGDWVDGFATGYDTDFAGFRVTIYADNTYAVVKRVIDTAGGTAMDATAGKGVVYTAAEQTTDFGSAQTTLYYTVAQLSHAGAGYAAQQVGT